MKKIYLVLFTAALATTFAACSKDDATTAITSYEEIVKAQPVPVTFGTYVSENAVTRAGETGNITTAVLKNAAYGFGVFAYYTNNDSYPSPNSTLAPNFMYNERLQYNDTGTPETSYWFYTPVKYWPNDFNGNNGAVDHQTTPATGSKSDRLSFFAYAPYVPVNANGEPTTSTPENQGTVETPNNVEVGITAVSTNSAPGDPIITYVTRKASTIDQSVDLLWGVAQTGGLSYAAANETSASAKATAGLPLLDLVKPAKSNATITFAFNHALAGLNLTAQASFNKGEVAYAVIPDETFIHIKEVVVKATLNNSGELNLNNETANVPNWTISNSENTQEKTFTLAINDISQYLKYTDAENDATSIQNGVGRESKAKTDTYTPAKSSAPQQVIAGNVNEGTVSMSKVFTMLPKSTSTTFTVKVDYVVRTKDDKLSTGYTEVENVITKTVNIATLEGNKVYTINMILGLEDVTLNAVVNEWGAGGATNVYLPQND